MTINKNEADLFATYILNNDIRDFCINKYVEFNKFQLNNQEPYIFTEEDFLQYERELNYNDN